MTEPQPSHAPILVTGAHRTGTTWVGKMLAASGQTAYISEPLNILHRPGVFITPTSHWYTYICADNESEFLQGLQDTISLRYHLLAEIRAIRSTKDLIRMGRDWEIFLRGRILHHRPLLKDPFAVFSAPWFAGRLGCQVVIILRHPAAFVSSLKRLNWPFDLADLLAQPFLMRDLLDPFRTDIEKAARSTIDPITQNSLLWRLVYTVVRNYQILHPEFRIVRHEDLSLNPKEAYRSLYHDLGLSFSARSERIILSSSSSENPNELTHRSAHSTQLNSLANLSNWKKRLSGSDIARVRELTEDLVSELYPDLEWE